jgi:hypothetical protein
VPERETGVLQSVTYQFQPPSHVQYGERLKKRPVYEFTHDPSNKTIKCSVDIQRSRDSNEILRVESPWSDTQRAAKRSAAYYCAKEMVQRGTVRLVLIFPPPNCAPAHPFHLRA